MKPITETIFLDLREFDTNRSSLRRLEKNLSGTKEFAGKKGRVLFFNLSPWQKENFYITITKALYKLGYKSVVSYQSLEELTN